MSGSGRPKKGVIEMRHHLGATVLAALALVVGPLSGIAGASYPPSDVSPNLVDGWGNAQACLVAPGGTVECFATVAAMRAQASQLTATTGVSCPVSLYSGANYTGRVLELTGQGYWMNLASYGFDNVTVSFMGTGCGFHLAEDQFGAGYWYPGYTGPNGAATNMGATWDDRVSSIYIT